MNSKTSFVDKLPKSLIRKANVTLFPEGALGYLVGPTLALLANSILSGYFNKYMSDILGINSWASTFFTLLPVISVIFVILGNILVGRLMDNSQSKLSKARPLLLFSVPISLIALLFLFIFAPFDVNDTAWHVGSLICIAIGYNLWFGIAYPMYYTPHAALVNLSTRNSKDRGLLATISNATALAAMGLTTMILPFFLKLLFVYDMAPASYDFVKVQGVDALVKKADFTSSMTAEYFARGSSIDAATAIYDTQASYDHWKIFVIALIAVTLVGALIEYFFTRERVTEEGGQTAEVKKALPIGQQAKICFSDKFWIIMIVFFFLYQLGGMMKNVSQLYYCTALFKDAAGVYTSANGGAISGFIAIIGAIPTAAGMVIALPLANKIGKGKAIMYGAIVSTLGGLLGIFFPDNLIIAYIAIIVKALGSTPAMYLSRALLGDILDHQEALHGTRTDGLTMTIYGAIMAGMTGIATGLMNVVISATGYDAINGVLSNDALRTWMPWIFFGGEAIGYGIIFITFFFMNVEKFGPLDQKAIIQDQKAAAAAEGRPYVSPEEKIRAEEGEEAYKAAIEKKEKEAADYEAKLAAMSAEQRKAALDAEAALLKEFNELRKANGRAPLQA